MPNRSSMMERLRAELLRRAHLERQSDIEANDAMPPSAITATPSVLDAVTTSPPRGVFSFLRLPQLFGRPRPPQPPQDEPELQSPKSPDFVSRRPPTLPPMHLDYQSLSDSVANPTREQITSASLAPHAAYPHAAPVTEQVNRPDPVARVPSRPNSVQLPALDSPDPEEQALAQLGVEGRRRRDARERRRRRGRREGRSHESRSHGSSASKPPPTTFLFCFPWVKSARMRALILQCFVSGMFLVTLLSIYLALSMTKAIKSGDFTIVLILTVLAATVVFCHALLRVFLLLYRGEKPSRRGTNGTRHYLSPNGYAVPQEPIPVVLAQDEEARLGDGHGDGAQGDMGKPIPPAYGLWRGSVRVDPNRLFWQRNEAAAANARPETREGPRPPSYASDDGVTYVVDAVPRSTAPPMTEIEMPLHPSEAGRAGHVVS